MRMVAGECWCALPQQLLILYLCMETFMWWRSPCVDPESRIFAHYSTVVQLPKHVCICAKHHQIKSTSMLFQCNHRLRTVFKRCALEWLVSPWSIFYFAQIHTWWIHSVQSFWHNVWKQSEKKCYQISVIAFEQIRQQGQTNFRQFTANHIFFAQKMWTRL